MTAPPAVQSAAMIANPTFTHYAARAKAATCPSCRTVNMLGMMCAAAAENRAILAFVGRGFGGDWPDPRKPGAGAATDDTADRLK